MFSIHLPIVLECLHGVRDLTTIHLAQVQVGCAGLPDLWEESRIEWLTAFSALSGAIRANEGVNRGAIIMLLLLLLEVIAIVLESLVASHPVSRGHTVRLVPVERASVRAIVASVLALVQEVVCHGLVHYATLPTDERATLWNQRIVLVMLACVANEFAVSDQLLSSTDVDIVGDHVVGDGRAEFLLSPLPRL